MPPAVLSERTRRLLATLVREYIETGEPVASATLAAGRARRVVGDHPQRPGSARGHGLRAAAAHVGRPRAHRPRLPLLRRHAARSAPRHPRPDVRRRSPAAPAGRRLAADGRSAVERVACALRGRRSTSGFAIAPADAHAIFQRIEFVPLSQTRVLVVMVSRGNQVTQKVVDVGEVIAPSALIQAANYLNTRVRRAAARRGARGRRRPPRGGRTLYDQLLAVALRLAAAPRRAAERRPPCTSTAPRRCSKAPTRPSRCRWRHCARCCAMVEEKQRLVQLLDDYIDGTRPDGGHRRRAHRPRPARLQLWCATYSRWRRRGTVGIIGPTRMRYSRAITSSTGRPWPSPGSSATTTEFPGRRTSADDVMSDCHSPDDLHRRCCAAAVRRPRPARSTPSRASATSCTTGCCARPPSSTITASASSASGGSWPTGPPPTLLTDVLAVVDDFERALASRRRPKRRPTAAASS